LGVSVCQWQTSCEPTESADETSAPKVWLLPFGAALTKSPARQQVRRQAQAGQWHKDSAARDSSRANPLSEESGAFLTHGEPQTVCRSVGP
jgi:hypothetical protein